jgi:hypothetical protein
VSEGKLAVSQRTGTALTACRAAARDLPLLKTLKGTILVSQRPEIRGMSDKIASARGAARTGEVGMKLNGATIADDVVRRVTRIRGGEHCFAELAPTRTALVVIDMQNAFMDDQVGLAVVQAARRHRTSGEPAR